MHRRMTEPTDDPTIFQVIREQHREVDELLTALADEEDTGRREELYAELRFQLERHARAEEAVFYDLLRRHDKTRAMAQHAQADHIEVRRLLAELDATACDDDPWDDLVAALAQAVRAHVATEESKLFDAARRLLDDGQARTLAETFEAVEDRVDDEPAGGSEAA
jgi:hemerythrin-like domain-containing protein